MLPTWYIYFLFITLRTFHFQYLIVLHCANVLLVYLTRVQAGYAQLIDYCIFLFEGISALKAQIVLSFYFVVFSLNFLILGSVLLRSNELGEIFVEDICPFCGETDVLFWTSGDIYPGFQSQGGSLRCTSDVIPADLLAANILSHLIHIRVHVYRHWWDSKPRIMCTARCTMHQPSEPYGLELREV